jgi:hypothetical protein
MVSESIEKILALIIVVLSFLSLPILIFLLVVAVFVDVTYIIQYYNTRNLVDAIVAAGLAIVSAVLLVVLRTLARWIRKR